MWLKLDQNFAPKIIISNFHFCPKINKKTPEKVAQNASKTVGIYPETKKPDWYHENLGISQGVSGWSMEMALVETVKKYGYKNPTGKNFSVE